MDVQRLEGFLDQAKVPGAGTPLDCIALDGGSQNQVFRVRRDGLDAVLRRPSPDSPPGRNEGILREWRIIAALAGTDVPHTPAIALCEDAKVIGAPFYLMGYVDGWSPVSMGDQWPSPFEEDLAQRSGLAYQLVEGAALLSKVDWRAAGLEGLGRPEGFHDRQVDRWLRFLERVRSRDLPGLDVASEWLRSHRPLDYQPGIMHGDYQFANVMYHHGGPARLAAIVDWEMGTVGDPKIDLGWVLLDWPDKAADVGGGGYVDRTGMPGRSDLLDHYSKVSGRQVDDIDYYVVLANWKLGIVLEQGYLRSTRGEGDVEKQTAFGPIVLELLQRAADVAESSDYKNAS